MSSPLNQYVTDIQGKATVIERKVQFFGISSLAKVEDNIRSWCVYRRCTVLGPFPSNSMPQGERKTARLKGMLTVYGQERLLSPP